MKVVYTLEDLFGYPIGDVTEDPATNTFSVYHYNSYRSYQSFKTKEEAEVFLNRIEYDLR